MDSMRIRVAGVVAALVIGTGVVLVTAGGDEVGRPPEAVTSPTRYHDSGEHKPKEWKSSQPPAPTPSATPVAP